RGDLLFWLPRGRDPADLERAELRRRPRHRAAAGRAAGGDAEHLRGGAHCAAGRGHRGRGHRDGWRFHRARAFPPYFEPALPSLERLRRHRRDRDLRAPPRPGTAAAAPPRGPLAAGRGLTVSEREMTALDNDLRNRLEELARACRILEMEGHGDMTLGHLSLRDPAGRGFWLKRNRIGLGEVLGADDFVLLDWDGRQLAGGGGRHSEWPIHGEILRMRADVTVVGHTHPFHACVFSASLDPLQPFSLDADYFIEVPRHPDPVALITTREEGAALARSLGESFA